MQTFVEFIDRDDLNELSFSVKAPSLKGGYPKVDKDSDALAKKLKVMKDKLKDMNPEKDSK